MPAICDISDVALRLDEHVIDGCTGDPYPNVIQQHSARILLWPETGEDDGPDVVGSMEFGIVEVSSRFDMRDVCDAHSQMYYDIWSNLRCARSYDFKASVQTALNDPLPFGGMIYIEKLDIAPQYRGRKVGLAALHLLRKHFARGCYSMFLTAHPYTYDGLSDKELSAACRALRNYYGQLGFRRIGKTHLMGLNLEYNQTVPAEWHSAL